MAIGLGSNLGDRRDLLQRALPVLAGSVTELQVASLYESIAVSYLPQPDFLNTVAVGLTALGPEQLLAVCKAIERSLGRRRGPRWGPRSLDLDLLLHGESVVATPELTVPHPLLCKRRFFLEPLAEIAPELVIPTTGSTVAAALERLPPEPPLRRLASPTAGVTGWS